MTRSLSPVGGRAVAALVLAGVVGGAVATGAVASPLRFTPNIGADRYQTSVFAEGEPTQTAYLVTGLNYPDGLTAGAVAGQNGGNVYLTRRDEIPESVRERVIYAKRIVVVGGEESIGVDVWSWLRQNTRADLVRVAGVDRIGTAIAMSRDYFKTPGVNRVVIATGSDYPDALTGGAAAAHVRSPLLLVEREQLPAAVAEELRRLKPQSITVVGGQDKVSDAVLAELRAYTAGSVDRIAGADRYDTAVKISAAFFDSAPAVTMTSGQGFADALSASAFAGRLGGPLLLASRDCVTEGTNLEIERLQRFAGENSYLNSFGGSPLLSEDARKRTNCQPAGTPHRTYLDDIAALDGSARYASDHANIGGHFYPRSAAFDTDPRNADYKAWSLGGKYTRFTTVAGLDDLNSSTFESTVEVYGDEKLLASRVVSVDHPATFDVDVRGVDRLKIVTTSPAAAPRSSVVGRANYVYFGDAAVS